MLQGYHHYFIRIPLQNGDQIVIFKRSNIIYRTRFRRRCDPYCPWTFADGFDCRQFASFDRPSMLRAFSAAAGAIGSAFHLHVRKRCSAAAELIGRCFFWIRLSPVAAGEVTDSADLDIHGFLIHCSAGYAETLAFSHQAAASFAGLEGDLAMTAAHLLQVFVRKRQAAGRTKIWGVFLPPPPEQPR